MLNEYYYMTENNVMGYGKNCAFTHAFMLFQNDKQPTDAVWREYHDMLYKLIPVARKMVAMGEDF